MEDTLRVMKIKEFEEMLKSLNPCFNGRYSQRPLRVITLYLQAVLILVLMEDTLREFHSYRLHLQRRVLILVLMEDTLRELIKKGDNPSWRSLNPCFNGRYSQRTRERTRCLRSWRLNPCFNGRYSQSQSYSRTP